MRVTIKKIADIAKVSRGTVDKVLNNRHGVSDEIRKKVKDIADYLEYRPNIIGKALASQKNPFIIGIIIPPDDNPYYDDIKRGIDAAYQELRDFNFRMEYHIMRSISAEEQVDALKYFIKNAVSGIVLAAMNHQDVKVMIDQAVIEHKIPVVTFITDIKDSSRLCFIGHDLVKSGRVAGQIMGKLICGEGKVAIITGSHGILAHNQRIEGFLNVINEEFKNIEIVKTVENMDRDSLSLELTLSLIETIKNLKGIYITGGGVSGAGKALQLSGLGGKIKVICFDFVPETIKLVKDGIIDFTIGQDPYYEGYKPVKVLADYLLSGRIPESEEIKTKIDIRVKENIDILD